MTEHIVTIDSFDGARHRAVCSCSWKQYPWTAMLAVAEALAEAHLAYHAEVQEMTRPPGAGEEDGGADEQDR